MSNDVDKKNVERDLTLILLITMLPMIIYLFFGDAWKSFSKSAENNFWMKFTIQSLLAFSMSGLGFTAVMVYRKEKFSQYGLKKNNMVIAIVMSILCFIPHFIFLLVTKGFHGYIPMSGAIIFDSIMEQTMLVKILCMTIVFAIWGFCEGFTYVFVGQKFNQLYPTKNKILNVGAIIGGVICVFLHGGISLNPIVLFDALTMFIFVYGILQVKEYTGNAWGCIFVFLFLWNAFPSI